MREYEGFNDIKTSFALREACGAVPQLSRWVKENAPSALTGATVVFLLCMIQFVFKGVE